MNFAKALAPLALLSLSMAAPVFAAKEAKVLRCNGQSKRPANPYGTIFPTLPPRSATAPTQFFPSSTTPTETGSAAKKEAVPPISEAGPLPTAPTSAPQPVYASC